MYSTETIPREAPSVGPGIRNRARKNIRVGEFDGEPWGKSYPVGLVLEIRKADPQSTETTEHDVTSADSPSWSIVWVVTSRKADPVEASTPGGCFPEMLDPDAGRKWSDGWTPSRLAEVSAIGERWHLNDMQAGCAHQTPVYAPDRYGRDAPSLDLTPACPVTGYKYGHAWLHEPVPADVAAILDELIA